MRQPKVIILHAPGTNRDREAALACEMAGGASEIVHINLLAAGERELAAYQMLVLPGGFSYGDDLSAGRLWANDLMHRFRGQLDAFISLGKPVLGICNGFQVLVKAGYLPGPPPQQRVTLTFNSSEHFECRWVRLRPAVDKCLFTAGLTEDILCPVAHGEGRLAVQNQQELDQLYAGGHIALTYAAEAGANPAGYPANPNGSVADIAGLCNTAGNVLGLMPHPEDHIYLHQHPRWTAGASGGLGIGLFINGVRAAARFI
ncbi:MAG: phosphoribosylformylglycinamidine synthase I [Chloroflexi bacterium]|nr:phosphoribosylformylglycinamidine synthase I [Chloroflexota bacterium]